MRAHLASTMFLCAILSMSAQPRPDPEDVLAKARDNMLDRTERLPNYTCVQTVDRKFLRLKKPSSVTLILHAVTQPLLAVPERATHRLGCRSKFKGTGRSACATLNGYSCSGARLSTTPPVLRETHLK